MKSTWKKSTKSLNVDIKAFNVYTTLLNVDITVLSIILNKEEGRVLPSWTLPSGLYQQYVYLNVYITLCIF